MHFMYSTIHISNVKISLESGNKNVMCFLNLSCQLNSWRNLNIDLSSIEGKVNLTWLVLLNNTQIFRLAENKIRKDWRHCLWTNELRSIHFFSLIDFRNVGERGRNKTEIHVGKCLLLTCLKFSQFLYLLIILPAMAVNSWV